MQNSLPSPYFHHYLGQNYISQPPGQDPWSGQGPLRNPEQPRSGIAIFDPASDNVAPVIFSDLVSDVVSDIDYWTSNNTDPNYLISPSQPTAPPQDFVFNATPHAFVQRPQQSQQTGRVQTHQAQVYRHTPPEVRPTRAQPSPRNWVQPQRRIQDSSPIDLRVTNASPSPDAHNFVNYDPTSSLFTDNYINHSLPSSVEHASSSPLAPASSPGGSEGMFSSYQTSDRGMALDTYFHDTLDRGFLPTPSPVYAARSPASSVELTFDLSPEEPEHRPARRSGGSRATGRPGGRALGTHLDARVAKAAHDMRKTVACWHCVLQRDKARPHSFQSQNTILTPPVRPWRHLRSLLQTLSAS